MSDRSESRGREPTGDLIGGKVMEPTGGRFAFEPAAVPEHPEPAFGGTEKSLAAKQAGQRFPRHFDPRRIRHVHREDEAASRLDDAENFRENLIVRRGSPSPVRFVEGLGVRDGEAGDRVMERFSFEGRQARTEVVMEELKAIAGGGLERRS